MPRAYAKKLGWINKKIAAEAEAKSPAKPPDRHLYAVPDPPPPDPEVEAIRAEEEMALMRLEYTRFAILVLRDAPVGHPIDFFEFNRAVGRHMSGSPIGAPDGNVAVLALLELHSLDVIDFQMPAKQGDPTTITLLQDLSGAESA